MVLENNGADDLALSGNGAFTFATPLVPGNSYSVTVRTQPTAPSQTCTITNGSGTLTDGNITGLTLNCVSKTTTTDIIGGAVQGLAGSGLVLQDNSRDNLTVSAPGAFAFATPLDPGAAYSVSVLSPPINPYQDCTVANGAGNAGANDVLDVAVSCKSNPNPTYSVSGTVTGLSAGSTIILQNNGRDNLVINANGPFQFTMPIPTGSAYSVASSSASIVIASPARPARDHRAAEAPVRSVLTLERLG